MQAPVRRPVGRPTRPPGRSASLPAKRNRTRSARSPGFKRPAVGEAHHVGDSRGHVGHGAGQAEALFLGEPPHGLEQARRHVVRGQIRPARPPARVRSPRPRRNASRRARRSARPRWWRARARGRRAPPPAWSGTRRCAPRSARPPATCSSVVSSCVAIGMPREPNSSTMAAQLAGTLPASFTRASHFRPGDRPASCRRRRCGSARDPSGSATGAGPACGPSARRGSPAAGRHGASRRPGVPPR